jgi:hypothetical protein
MTAVQALTAGVGQHLAILSRGGTQGLMAGMTTLRSAQGLARSMGAITGSTLGDVLLVGAVTGAMGGLGTTALSEATWSKGVGAGIGELFEGILTGAFSGLATSAVSSAFEALPVGRTAAGVRRSLGDVIGESRNPAVRSVLKGASSGLGAASGRGVELGIGSVTGRYKGDAGDIVTSMAEAGAMAAVQDTAGGAVEGPVRAAQQARERRRAAAPSARPEGEPTPRPGGEPPPRPGGPPSPPLSELAPPTTPPPTGQELPARPPGAEREAPAPPPPAEELRPPVGAPTAGTAAAVGDRFRGDVIKLPRPMDKVHMETTVDRALPGLVGDQGIFREGSHGPVRSEDGERLELSIRGRSGEHIEVHVVVSLTMAEGVPPGELVPVARFQREPGAKAFVIEVSAGAHPLAVERALAHELSEITALHAGRQDSADALAPGATAKSLSPHDEGRLAEFEVLARQLAAAESKGEVQIMARLRDDAELLVAHLGLMGDTDAVRDRAALALRNMPEGSPGRSLLEQAITGAETNPFLQPRVGEFERDLPILARQLEVARAMGNAELEKAVIARGRLLLLSSRKITQKGKQYPTRRFDPPEAEKDLVKKVEESVRRSPELTFEERRALGRRKPDLGYEARYTTEPTLRPEAQLAPASARAIEDRRIAAGKALEDAKKSLPETNPAQKPEIEKAISQLNGEINSLSEELGMAAGRQFAERQLKLPASAEVQFGRQGKGLPDLLYDIPGGPLVVIECKGGTSELGVRLSVDRTKLVQQGTPEYLESLARTMADSANETISESGRRLLAELKKKPPNIHYYHVNQPIGANGRATAPLVGRFDLEARP